MPWLLILLVAAVIILSSKRAFGYVKGVAVELDLADIGRGMELRADAAVAWFRMVAAAANDGIALYPESAFRTMEEQEALFKAYQAGTGNLAARPGYSNHQSGIAVDVSVRGSFSSAEYRWLEAHAPSFGFVNTGKTFSQPEPWHWEYRNA